MQALLDFAVSAAREAGEATLRYFLADAADQGIETKDNNTPVTRADKRSEEILRERIRAAYPGDGIVGEEFGEDTGRTGRRWILDPVDGTRSFVHGVPLYGTLVALEEEGRAVVGVIHLPALDETVSGAHGCGAWWDRRGRRVPARVSETADPAAALFCYTSANGFRQSGHGAVHSSLRETFGRDRGWSDCYGHALVATGRVDVMVDTRMALWDTAALYPVVVEAGGRFTDLAGHDVHDGGSAISSNGRLHDAVLRHFDGDDG
ncbi:MAG: inositol monophosphatase family protein [Planctomycetota bacterium]|jgi:histidinol phosphatase-like enzyme (inositol monophosphatase family)